MIGSKSSSVEQKVQTIGIYDYILSANGPDFLSISAHKKYSLALIFAIWGS